mgnify:CR=1 FL=1
MATGVVHVFDPNRFVSSVGGLTGATVYFYYTGTTNPAPVFSDLALTIPATNPVVLAQGAILPNLYLDPAVIYRRRIVFSDTSVQDVDPIFPRSFAQSVDLLSTSSNLGAGLIGYNSTATYPASTVGTKLKNIVHATDYGVVGDGIVDDTTNLQAAINAAVGKILYLPPVFKCGALTVPAKSHLMGTGGKSRITAVSGTYNMFSITGGDVKIENIFIEDITKSGGWDFIITCGTKTLRFIDLKNIIVNNSFGVLTDSGTGTGGVGAHVVTRVQDVLAALHRGPGISLTRGFAYLFFERCSIDFVGVSASNFTAFNFNLAGHGGAAGGLTLVDCTVLGTCGTYANAAQHGWTISNTAAVWMQRCSADTVAGSGMILDNINAVKMADCWVSLCGGDGIVMTTVFNSIFVGLACFGRNYLTPNGAGTDGIRIVSGCYNLNFTGGIVSSWGRHGFNKSAIQTGAIRITGMLLLSNGLAGVGYGVNDIGNSAMSLVSCGFGSRVQGKGNLQGTFSCHGLRQLNSGAGNQSAGPGPLTF